MLREELRKRLLADRGIDVTEACDNCGQLLGPVRYTRKNESGVWCSRECRDGKEAVEQQAIRNGGRPRKHANGAEKQKAYRERKPPCTLMETKDLQAQKSALSTIPLTPILPAQKSPLIEFEGGL